jgi:hypothetical protein
MTTSSAQVCWWVVHEHVAPILATVGAWPMAGTVEWHQLDDDDPRKLAALLDAAQHWALRVDTTQEAIAQAGEAISVAAPWARIAQANLNRAQWEDTHPWARPARREAS